MPVVNSKTMSKKRLPFIKVDPLPNGYALTVGKHEYMALSPESLVDIFFTHVAIGQLEYINRDMAAGLLQAAATWQTVGESLSANAQLIAEARRAERDYNSAIRGQAKANEECEKALKERDRLKTLNIELEYEVKKLKDKIDGIGKTLVGQPKSRPLPVVDSPRKKYDRGDIRKSDIYGSKKPKKKGKSRYAREE